MGMLKEKNVRASFPQRLVAGTRVWSKMLKPALEKRNKILDVWTSGYHSQEMGNPRPVNLTDRGLGILVPYLVMSNPKVMIKTRYNELRSYAYTMELALNFHAAASKLAERTLRPAVLQAMIGMGIVKTGVMHKYDVEMLGAMHQLGEVFSEVVDYANYIGDPMAEQFDAFEFEGDFYSLPTDYAKEFFGPKHADNIRPTYKLWGDPRTEQVVKYDVKEDLRKLKEYTEFADYYIPDENIIVTIDPHADIPKILRTVEVEGNLGSPYDKLTFKSVPGTPIPVPPVWGWLDMEDTINLIVSKMKAQAEEEKTVLGYQGNQGAKDAGRIAKAGDRATVRVDDINGIKLFEFPGINESYYNWIQYLETQYSIQGSNLYTMGGRGQQAGTLGQEQMMMSNASRSVNDMMNNVYKFTHNIFQKRAFHMWDDPALQIVVEKKVTEKISVPALFSKVDHRGDFWKYSFDMIPYSMQRMGPDLEYQRLITYLTQIAIPLAQVAASQGKQLNVDEVTSMSARYMGLEEIDRIWTSAVPENDLSMNPYNPQASGSKTTKPRGNDPRDGNQDASSRQMNQIQQQTRTGGSDQVQK